MNHKARLRKTLVSALVFFGLFLCLMALLESRKTAALSWPDLVLKSFVSTVIFAVFLFLVQRPGVHNGS